MYHVISLVGPAGHGKTTLLLPPTEYYMATMDVSKHVVERPSNAFFEVWDTPGLTRYHEIRDKTLRRCDAHLLVIRSGTQVDSYWEDVVDSTPGLWVVLVVRGKNVDGVEDFCTRKNIPFRVVRDPEDAWDIAAHVLEEIIPRIKTSPYT